MEIIKYFFVFLSIGVAAMLIPFLIGRSIWRHKYCAHRKYILLYDQKVGAFNERQAVDNESAYTGKGIDIIGVYSESCIDDFMKFLNDHYLLAWFSSKGKPFSSDYVKKLFEYYREIRGI